MRFYSRLQGVGLNAEEYSVRGFQFRSFDLAHIESHDGGIESIFEQALQCLERFTTVKNLLTRLGQAVWSRLLHMLDRKRSTAMVCHLFRRDPEAMALAFRDGSQKKQASVNISLLETSLTKKQWL